MIQPSWAEVHRWQRYAAQALCAGIVLGLLIAVLVMVLAMGIGALCK